MVVDDGTFGSSYDEKAQQRVLVDQGFLTTEVQVCLLQLSLSLLSANASLQLQVYLPAGRSPKLRLLRSAADCEGDVVLRVEPLEPLVLLREDSGEDGVWTFTAPNLSALAFNIDLLSSPEQYSFKRLCYTFFSSNPQLSRKLLGRTHVSAEEVRELYGTITRSLLSTSLTPVAHVTFSFLVITPFAHPANSMSSPTFALA